MASVSPFKGFALAVLMLGLALPWISNPWCVCALHSHAAEASCCAEEETGPACCPDKPSCCEGACIACSTGGECSQPTPAKDPAPPPSGLTALLPAGLPEASSVLCPIAPPELICPPCPQCPAILKLSIGHSLPLRI